MKINKNILIFLSVFTFIIMSKCFIVKKYLHSDKEIEEHYKNLNLKPSYKKTIFLNRQLHYVVMSKSDTLPLLVFIHGAPGVWYGYMNLMDDTLLQKKYKMISVDRLGYGKSGYGKPETSTQLQALAIKKIIDKENFSGKKIVLLGRSYGAPIAAWVSINYPQLVEKLFMVSPVIDPDKEKFYWFSRPGKWKAVQWMLPKMLNVATAEKYTHEKEMKMMLPKWKKLYTPTCVIVGENDNLADTANFSFAKKYLKNCDATFLKLQNTGHLVTYEQPELIINLLLQK